MKLGSLKKVENLKEAWDNEATSFTPWLAQEESIAILAETLGFTELVVEAQEKAVGPFRADILCKDPSSDSYVLIENQLEKTDHSHLGQLLTYAAGLQACTIVWIAKKFTNEHRAALDWLNEITDERFHFFGLEIELWKIGNSDIAPNFNVVSKPNDWTRSIKDAAKDAENHNATPRDLLLKDFWVELQKYLEEKKSKVRTQKPAPQGWTNVALGRTNINLVAVARVKKQSLSVHVVMYGTNRHSFFEQLFSEKEKIELEIGQTLDWLKLDDKKENQIRLTIENIDLLDRKKWHEQILWMTTMLEAFHKAFSARARALVTNLDTASD